VAECAAARPCSSRATSTRGEGVTDLRVGVPPGGGGAPVGLGRRGLGPVPVGEGGSYLQGVIEFYRTRSDTKMTIAAERLTVIAVITLPVTALSSVYGMNIIVNDRTDFPHLAVVVTIMAVMSATLLTWAKRQGPARTGRAADHGLSRPHWVWTRYDDAASGLCPVTCPAWAVQRR
jgi:hypothetical protein